MHFSCATHCSLAEQLIFGSFDVHKYVQKNFATKNGKAQAELKLKIDESINSFFSMHVAGATQICSSRV